MKNRIIILGIFIFSVFIINPNNLFAESNEIQVPVLSEDNPSNPGSSKWNGDSSISKSINLDMQALYGFQYNQMFSGFNISQERDSLVYLLTSKFNRSGNFGYNDKQYDNSSFYENTAGLTVNWNFTDAKLILEGETDNESRGMFDNDIYSNEDKGNNKLSAKTIIKVNPSTEFFFSLGGAWYKHNLVPTDTAAEEKSRVLQGNAKIGGEYVWSSSNRMRLNADMLYYDYKPSDVENDRHIRAEAIDDFNITGNVGISLGVGYVNNKDNRNMFPVPVSASLSFKEFKYLTTMFLYKYDILPFRPEEFYLQQKYINPTYNLPPQAVHTGEVKTESRINSVLNIKCDLKVEKSNNYYNYYTVYGNVLSAGTMKTILYNPSVEANFSFSNKIWEISLTYNYRYFDADQNITYEPDHEGAGAVRYNGKNWKIEWANTLRGSVYTNPDSSEKLPEAVIGSIGIQRQMLEGSYFYCKIENLYNKKYSLRKGYPEPGISFLGGLRILI